jgi:uncharacterized membrane protein YfcA
MAVYILILAILDVLAAFAGAWLTDIITGSVLASVIVLALLLAAGVVVVRPLAEAVISTLSGDRDDR